MSQQLLGDGTKYVYDRHRRQRTPSSSLPFLHQYVHLPNLLTLPREAAEPARHHRRQRLPAPSPPHRPTPPLRHHPRAPPRITTPSGPQDIPLEPRKLPLHLWHSAGHPHHLPRRDRGPLTASLPRCLLRRRARRPDPLRRHTPRPRPLCRHRGNDGGGVSLIRSVDTGQHHQRRPDPAVV